MDGETYVEWLRRQGFRVVRTQSTWWYEASRRVLQAAPQHLVIQPEEAELEGLLRAERAVALRCSTPPDAPTGRTSYHVICADHGYALEQLEKRTRQTVRTGLARCRVEQVPLERLAREGFQLEVDTCRRQGREVPMTEAQWRRRHLAAAALPGFEAWAALVDGRLGATILVVRIGEWALLLAQQSLSELLPARPNNAVTFGCTRDLLARPGIRALFYTLESLDAPPSVDAFKLKMGYVVRPVRQRVMFHPWAAPLIGPRAQQLVARAARCRPGSRLLAKAEGMIRFHLEGKRPAAAPRVIVQPDAPEPEPEARRVSGGPP